jgi:hypothetical protein
MARDRKNYARKPPAAQFPTGLPYGKATELQQQAASMPQAAMRTPPVGGAPSPQPTTAPTPGQPGFSLEAAMAQMAQMSQVTPLNAPTQRPGEPLLAGVDAGDGPGSEVLPAFARTDRSHDVFAALAEATGDPAFDQLAQLARGR